MSNTQFYGRSLIFILGMAWISYIKLDLNSVMFGALLMSFLNDFKKMEKKDN